MDSGTKTNHDKHIAQIAEAIARPEVQAYIDAQQHAEPYQLLLQKSPFTDLQMKDIVAQIIGRRVAQKKFPFTLTVPSMVYPTKLSLEQASSELTATYKRSLISGQTMADLTGGMGIDCFLMGQYFTSCDYVEPDPALFATVQHNFMQLGFKHCTMHNTDCTAFLSVDDCVYDWLYIDPSRRSGSDRQISLSNHTPNIVEIQDQLRAKGQNTLIKLSPMQDITECINTLQTISHVWILSVKNDVKELLLQMTQDKEVNPRITAVDLTGDREAVYEGHHHTDQSIQTGAIMKYLYQPAPALVKSGLSNQHARDLGLKKVHQNTSFYTGDDLHKDYFGRVFEVVVTTSANRKSVAKYLPSSKANVITKNFPLTPAQLSKRLKLSDGGTHFVIGMTDHKEDKVVAICNRMI